MSKILPFALAGAGATATSVGGVYLIRGTTAPSKSEGKEAAPSTSLKLFENLSDFKTDKGDGCVKGLFGSAGIDMSALTSSAAPSTSFSLGTAAQDAAAETIKSCLVINWKKTEYAGSDNKWSGTFTWSWSFINGNKGFIIFNVAKTKEPNKLSLTGGTYLLEKTNNRWEIKHHKEVNDGDNKAVDKGSFDSNFPKAKANLSVLNPDNKNHWDFIDAKEKLDKACDASSCTGAGTARNYDRKWMWTWSKAGGANKVGEWGENLNWWNHIYAVSDFKLSEQLGSFGGTWALATSKG